MNKKHKLSLEIADNHFREVHYDNDVLQSGDFLSIDDNWRCSIKVDGSIVCLYRQLLSDGYHYVKIVLCPNGYMKISKKTSIDSTLSHALFCYLFDFNMEQYKSECIWKGYIAHNIDTVYFLTVICEDIANDCPMVYINIKCSDGDGILRSKKGTIKTRHQSFSTSISFSL